MSDKCVINVRIYIYIYIYVFYLDLPTSSFNLPLKQMLSQTCNSR